tara:strand:- start:36173 stop:37009 length:837 start_codon:yes stop_codon:yes gene_type:complete
MIDHQDAFSFEGKTVIVTGGNGGIGQGMVRAFAQRGAQVVIADHAPAAEHERFADNPSILDCRTDITDRASVDAMVEQTLATFGQIDVLVNNAGGGKGFARLLEVTPADIDWMIELNIRGTLWVTQAVTRHFVERGGGAIVNIASAAAISGTAGRNDPVYAGCKGFMVSLTRALAADLGQYDIRVNTIAPGWIVPESSAGISAGSFWNTLGDTFGTPESFNAAYEAGEELPTASARALQRLGRPADIANAAVYLASAAARHVTGQLISVCGGAVMPAA